MCTHLLNALLSACRLPVIQGASAALLSSAIVISNSKFQPCSTKDFSNLTLQEQEDLWLPRMLELQGAISVASVFEMLVGLTGRLSERRRAKLGINN